MGTEISNKTNIVMDDSDGGKTTNLRHVFRNSSSVDFNIFDEDKDFEMVKKPENYPGATSLMDRLLSASASSHGRASRNLDNFDTSSDISRAVSACSRDSIHSIISVRTPNTRPQDRDPLARRKSNFPRRRSSLGSRSDIRRRKSQVVRENGTRTEPGRTGWVMPTATVNPRLQRFSMAHNPRGIQRSSSQLSIKLHKLLAKERFKHASRLVLILLKWISSLSEKGGDSDESGGRTFTDIANEAYSSNTLGNSGLSFDVSEFKAKKEVNISNETKAILSTPSYLRTPEQLQTALYGLQHLKSFAEYPLHMQEKLCKVAWFQQVPPKRVIIRQGHFAENFYFILSGQAVVRILEKNPKTGDTQLRTATIMRKGTSFGELALLHHSVRTATVVSQDTVQLLAIGRDDFFEIFMSGHRTDGIPEHIKFVSSLDFMKHWPIDKLVERPEVCLFHFFKRGVVIVKDSTQSDWLYIIKSGSCQVMTQLKSVTAKLDLKAKTAKTKKVLSLPKLGTGDIGSKVENGRKPANEIRTPSPIARARQEYMKNYVSDIGMEDDGSKNKEKAQANPIASKKDPGFSKSRFHEMPCIKKAHFAATQDTEENIAYDTEQQSKVHEGENLPPNEGLPIYVQVEVLKPKDVFGLSSVQFDHEVEIVQTSVSLVSNGAECIMLSKKFFIEHANEQVKKLIRYQVRPYPTHTTLQENLQTQVDWNMYKKRLMRHTLSKLKIAKSVST